MPRASAADAAETARRILTVATVHFAEAGYTDASVDEVARAAGVTRGAVYHHYSSKPGLFAAVAAAQQQIVAEAIIEATDGLDASDALRAGSHAFLDAITAGRAARILLVDGPAALSWEDWRRLDAEGPLLTLREGLAATGLPAPLLDAVTAAVSGAMNELALWLAERPDGAHAHPQAHAALTLLLDALTPTPTPHPTP
ncbi:MAG: TetR/AcrR family transcriptional regulator [Actinomycetota bacterium]